MSLRKQGTTVVGLLILGSIWGCANDQTFEATANVAAETPTEKTVFCTAGKIFLASTETELRVEQISRDTRYTRQMFDLSPIVTNIEPVLSPKYSCTQGSSTIVVWENIARVNSKYYRLTPVLATKTVEFTCRTKPTADSSFTVDVERTSETKAVLVLRQPGRALERIDVSRDATPAGADEAIFFRYSAANKDLVVKVDPDPVPRAGKKYEGVWKGEEILDCEAK